MGRIVIQVADLPQSRRERFTAEEVDRLAQEVALRKNIIYGSFKYPPQPQQVRQAWQEIAEIVSSLSGIERSADKCRKRFNVIKRRGQMTSVRKRGRPPKNRPKISNIYPAIANKNVEPQDLEFEVEYQAPLEDDPDYEPSSKQKKPVSKVEPKEPTNKAEAQTASSKIDEPEASPSNSVATLSRIRPTTVNQEEQPFLELQQEGFDMLQRELSGFQESMSSLNTRLNQIEVMLRPIGHIADSLARIASAVERLTCPPSGDF